MNFLFINLLYGPFCENIETHGFCDSYIFEVNVNLYIFVGDKLIEFAHDVPIIELSNCDSLDSYSYAIDKNNIVYAYNGKI